MALAHQAELLRRGVSSLICGAIGGFDFLALRQRTQDAERDNEAATAFRCVDVCHVRLRCRVEIGHSAVIFPLPGEKRRRAMTRVVLQKYNHVQYWNRQSSASGLMHT